MQRKRGETGPGGKGRRALAAFARCRGGGAMLVGGAMAMLMLVTVGGMMANYGWHEAQREEIRMALRAAVASASHLMRGDVRASEEAIEERIADFLRGQVEGLTVSKDDVSISHDPSTGRMVVAVGGDAAYRFSSLWPGGYGGSPTALEEEIVVEFRMSRYEFALALDVSASMGQRPRGWSMTRIDAMKRALDAIATTIEGVSRTNPGAIALSIVPFANVVNVADTSGTGRTADKERYVRMLAGAEFHTQRARDSEGHWVDSYHAYGTGADMGPLASRSLPDFATPADWNLRRAESEDISLQAPAIGTWSFEGSDFWNGCVMARWGAYWHADARPAIWDPLDAGNWPATTHADGWEPGSAWQRDLPLHLSDEPPDAGDPHTRFTAYSWPDARIAGLADHRLSEVMRRTLDPDAYIARTLGASDNHWHLRGTDRGGSLLCPEASIVPLTDDLAALRAAQGYRVVQTPSAYRWGQTFMHLGVVWGLRTLSPLWRDVWDTRSVAGDDLPRRPCGPGGAAAGCSPLVEKAIVIVSDGANFLGIPGRGRTFGRYAPGGAVAANPSMRRGRCVSDFLKSEYKAAMAAEDAATFADSFDVDARGAFAPAGLSAALDAFQSLHPGAARLDPADIGALRRRWAAALGDMTPWQLFRGHDPDSPAAGADAVDVLVDPANMFGFAARPVQNDHHCRPHMPFSAYGRVNDLVSVGDGPPVADVAPFSFPAWSPSDAPTNLQNPLVHRLDDWFLESCRIAGDRGVRIHAIYIGGRSVHELPHINLLEGCVDRGHMANHRADEVHVTPTAAELRSAIESIISIRRRLRFIG